MRNKMSPKFVRLLSAIVANDLLKGSRIGADDRRDHLARIHVWGVIGAVDHELADCVANNLLQNSGNQLFGRLLEESWRKVVANAAQVNNRDWDEFEASIGKLIK